MKTGAKTNCIRYNGTDQSPSYLGDRNGRNLTHPNIYMKSSDAKASKCHFKFSSKMTIFIKLV